MQEITIGDVMVRADHAHLVFQRHDSSEPQIKFDSDGFKELFDFLCSCAANETNRRRSFRVPVRKSELRATLTVDHQLYAVKPLNLSVSGIFVEFAAHEVPGLPRDKDVQLDLAFEGKLLTAAGVVRHRDGNSYGINFTQSSGSLAELVMELQGRWIANRIGT